MRLRRSLAIAALAAVMAIPITVGISAVVQKPMENFDYVFPQNVLIKHFLYMLGCSDANNTCGFTFTDNLTDCSTSTLGLGQTNVCTINGQLATHAYGGAVTLWQKVAPVSGITPFGPPNNVSTVAVTADKCRCLLYSTAATITPDKLTLEVTTPDAGDHMEAGIFSSDGASRYFKCNLVVTGTGFVTCTNTDTAAQLSPGDYWYCDSVGNTTPAAVFRATADNASGTTRMMTFTQDCTGGFMPTTLTSPTRTPAFARSPWINVTDE